MLRLGSRPVPVVVVSLALLSISACSSGAGTESGKGDDDDDGSTATPTPSPTPDGVHITSHTTWTGAVSVTENTTVDAGVTLTIEPGAAITFAAAKRLAVEGTLVANGAAGSPISLQAASPSSKWHGVHALPGGSVTLGYVNVSDATTGFVANAGALESGLLFIDFTSVSTPLTIAADTRICRASFVSGNSYLTGGAISIEDSDFTGGGGDTFSFSGTAALTFDHVHIGTTWHCLLHGGGSNTSVAITNSAFDDAAYLFMSNTLTAEVHSSSILLGSGDQNFAALDGNTTNTVDATGNYWGTGDGTFESSGQAVPAGWDVSGALATAPAGAGPRAGAGCEATF